MHGNLERAINGDSTCLLITNKQSFPTGVKGADRNMINRKKRQSFNDTDGSEGSAPLWINNQTRTDVELKLSPSHKGRSAETPRKTKPQQPQHHNNITTTTTTRLQTDPHLSLCYQHYNNLHNIIDVQLIDQSLLEWTFSLLLSIEKEKLSCISNPKISGLLMYLKINSLNFYKI